MKLCFEDADAPIADNAKHTEKAHGKLTVRRARTSQLLHGYSDFPGLRQVVEVKRDLTERCTGRKTSSVEYGLLSLSPRVAGARTCMKLMRRHWSVENKNNHVRDDSWREDRQVWRRGHTAYVMSMLLSVALNLLRTMSPHWRDQTPLTERAAIVNDLTLTPRNLLRRVS